LSACLIQPHSRIPGKAIAAGGSVAAFRFGPSAPGQQNPRAAIAREPAAHHRQLDARGPPLRMRCAFKLPHRSPARPPHAARPPRRSVAMAAAVPKRLLGNTGLQVSILGFGASPLGSVFEVGRRPRRRVPGMPGYDSAPGRPPSSGAPSTRGSSTPLSGGRPPRAPRHGWHSWPGAAAAACRQRGHSHPHPPAYRAARRPQQINEDEGVAAVHEAFRLGINFFDTSPFYGATRSEQVRRRRRRHRCCA
jgi:hypothetical protein